MMTSLYSGKEFALDWHSFRDVPFQDSAYNRLSSYSLHHASNFVLLKLFKEGPI
jgi:urease accessory protein UreH